MQPQLTSHGHFVILSNSTHTNTESLQRLIHMPSFSPPYLPPPHFSLCRIFYGGTRPAWHHLLDACVLTSLPDMRQGMQDAYDAGKREKLR